MCVVRPCKLLCEESRQAGIRRQESKNIFLLETFQRVGKCIQGIETLLQQGALRLASGAALFPFFIDDDFSVESESLGLTESLFCHGICAKGVCRCIQDQVGVCCAARPAPPPIFEVCGGAGLCWPSFAGSVKREGGVVAVN